MAEKPETAQPYGENITKRPVSVNTEKYLFVPLPRASSPTEGHTRFTLVDYMGSDQSVIYAATMGLGVEAIGYPDPVDFLHYLRQQHHTDPFHFAELKWRIEAPINLALFFVYLRQASVNEYSGRYSELREDVQNILGALVKLPLPEDRKRRIAAIGQTSIGQTQQAYKELLRDGLARELARVPMSAAVYTEFFWKMSLEDLFCLFKKAPLQKEIAQREVREACDLLEDMVRLFAPMSYEAVLRGNVRRETTTLPSMNRRKIRELLREKPRDSAPYGMQPTRRPTVEAAEQALFVPSPVLDRGFVMPIDYMGSDQAIVDAARTSYGKGTKAVNPPRGLIRHLVRNDHTTPIEQAEIAILEYVPLMVHRQGGRHRTLDRVVGFFDGIIETDDVFIPPSSELKGQDIKNRQARADHLPLPEATRERILETFRATAEQQRKTLERIAEESPEARELLEPLIRGVGSYIRVALKGEAHNWFHYLRLRLDHHAQAEIREVSKPIGAFIKNLLPYAWEAFEDFKLDRVAFGRKEKAVLTALIGGSKEMLEDLCVREGMISKEQSSDSEKLRKATEFQEFEAKVKTLGLSCQRRFP